MTNLIACLSTGKGTWSDVLKLINSEEWEKVYLITNEFGKEKFKHENAELIVISEGNINSMSDEIYNKLKGKVGFSDVAINIISGSGKEHMALIPALLKLGTGIRFVTVENEKLVEV